MWLKSALVAAVAAAAVDDERHVAYDRARRRDARLPEARTGMIIYILRGSSLVFVMACMGA